eukprot:261483-Ditylum_brightwellii.AAC.1
MHNYSNPCNPNAAQSALTNSPSTPKCDSLQNAHLSTRRPNWIIKLHDNGFNVILAGEKML